MADEDVDTERERMLAWIAASWEELAALAWRGYVLDGRGIVVLRGDWQGEMVVAYQTPARAEEFALAWPPELHDAVRQYEPAIDILFLVQRADSGILLGMRTPDGHLPPREAGQRDGSPPLVRSA
jgi:hypothetical protein